MKLRHYVPPEAFRSGVVTADYQAEVDAHTDKAAVDFERAERRLAAAEDRNARAAAALGRASGRKAVVAARREAAVAAELVELRRRELQRIEVLMKGVPASLAHRGRKAYRPVPQPGRQV